MGDFRKIKLQQQQLEDETSLNFKDHRDFFRTFFDLRLIYSKNLANMLENSSKQNKDLALNSLYALIDWTNSQLSKRLDVLQLKKDILNAFQTKDKTDLYFELDNLYQKISKVHEETELIPKVQVTSQEETDKVKFWKDEENAAVKELKKAWHDMFLIE